jgi:hypothetical protein
MRWEIDESAMPFVAELPAAGAALRPLAAYGRLAAYAVFFGVLMAVCVQFHRQLGEAMVNGQVADAEYAQAIAAWRALPSDAAPKAQADARASAVAAGGVVLRVQRSQGDILTWRSAIRACWAGQNIYEAWPGAGLAEVTGGAVDPGKSARQLLEEQPRAPHPNMPFLVILLTPLAYLPMQMAAAVVNVLKLLCIVGAILAAAAVANHRAHRMGEWVVGLSVLACLASFAADIQNGATDIFILAALIAHLWLHRKGRDGWAGGALALAVCFTPGSILFAGYWLYQRNWRLLGGLAVGLAAMVVAVPAGLLGPARFGLLLSSWLGNVFWPGLLHGPAHPAQFIIAGLAPATGAAILAAIGLALLGVMAWAMGWRKLDRADGRRCLHYGLVIAAISILGWHSRDGQSMGLLAAYAACWYAVGYGLLGPALRRVTAGALALLVAAQVLTSNAVLALLLGKARGHEFSDLCAPCGTSFWHGVAVFVVGVALLAALGRAARLGAQPYVNRRQTIWHDPAGR